MLSGLTNDYGSFVTHIQQHEPLPSFETIKSKFALEEITISQRHSHDTENAAFISQNTSNNRPHNPKIGHPPSPLCFLTPMRIGPNVLIQAVPLRLLCLPW